MAKASELYLLGYMKLKLQYSGHLMWRADSLEKTLMLGKTEGRKRSGWQRIRRLDEIIDSMDRSLSKLLQTLKDREAWRAAVHAVVKSQTWLCDWTELNWKTEENSCFRRFVKMQFLLTSHCLLTLKIQSARQVESLQLVPSPSVSCFWPGIHLSHFYLKQFCCSNCMPSGLLTIICTETISC